MKIGWFLFAISGQSVNSQDQLQDDLTKIARARDEMARAIGSIDTFIYGSLREKPAIGARSGTSKPEQIKDKLNARLIEIQERFAKVLDKCGPGANKDITKDESKSELTGFQRTNDLFQPSFGPGGLGHPNYISDMPMGFMPGSDDVNQFKKLDQTGQTDADIFGGIPPGGFGGEHGFGFGDRFGFGNGGHVGLSNFDPLNAMNFHTSTRRRRRFADGQKVTKKLIRQKIREMNKSFAPMEEFVSNNMIDCTESRRARMMAKIEKTKARVEKVVNRQGQNLMKKKNK